ncbi:hypothetical protein JMJ35_003825 [Cladonia borealis]|uniref:Uncharacterized protein n=1 Tax=Cladonia borealis TaxID=184061 RepID=A0AA39R6A0_9LECA|nr:hypothetical protein JMJ35_003825 [Cladonia borealis]
MVPNFAETFHAPVMAWIQFLESALEKRSSRRAAKKAEHKATKFERKSWTRESCLEEGIAEMNGHGLWASNDCNDEEDNSRFKGNPHGEGSYKTFELPSPKSTSTTECNTTPNSSPRISGTTRATSITEDGNEFPLLDRFYSTRTNTRNGDLPRAGPPFHPRDGSVDWKPKKRKGMAPEGRNEGDSAAKDYQDHLDRTATLADLLRRGKIFVIMKRGFR